MASGKIHCGVRWNIVRCEATPPSAPTSCTPVEPLPTTPTRRPRVTISSRQRAECTSSPANVSSPSNGGMFGWCRKPDAQTSTRKRSVSPPMVSTSHSLPVQLAETISLSKRMCSRRPVRRETSTW